ncbi:hypothetical protein HpKG132_09670 [Helicobacter pylori]
MPYFFNEYDLTKNANREEPERLRKQVIFILMRTPKGREILKEYLNEGLCAWVRWVYWGEGLKWQEPNPKELFNLGIKSYKEQDFSQAKEYFEKRLDAIMLKIMLER